MIIKITDDMTLSLQVAQEKGYVIDVIEGGYLIHMPDLQPAQLVQGEKGDTGEKGATGDKGEKGDTGADGHSIVSAIFSGNNIVFTLDDLEVITLLNGKTTLKGVTGAQGIQGETGEQGIQGEQGLQGEQGIQGEQGLQGEQGIQGETGGTWTDADALPFTDTNSKFTTDYVGDSLVQIGEQITALQAADIKATYVTEKTANLNVSTPVDDTWYQPGTWSLTFPAGTYLIEFHCIADLRLSAGLGTPIVKLGTSATPGSGLIGAPIVGRKITFTKDPDYFGGLSSSQVLTFAAETTIYVNYMCNDFSPTSSPTLEIYYMSLRADQQGPGVLRATALHPIA